MNRNIIIGIVVVIIILAGVFLIFKSKPALDTALFDKDEAELNAFNNDIALFDQDNTVLDEINQTFNDILNEGAVVSAESALDLTSLEQEASAVDFSSELNIFDEDILQELDQSFGEVLQ